MSTRWGVVIEGALPGVHGFEEGIDTAALRLSLGAVVGQVAGKRECLGRVGERFARGAREFFQLVGLDLFGRGVEAGLCGFDGGAFGVAHRQ